MDCSLKSNLIQKYIVSILLTLFIFMSSYITANVRAFSLILSAIAYILIAWLLRKSHLLNFYNENENLIFQKPKKFLLEICTELISDVMLLVFAAYSWMHLLVGNRAIAVVVFLVCVLFIIHIYFSRMLKAFLLTVPKKNNENPDKYSRKQILLFVLLFIASFALTLMLEKVLVPIVTSLMGILMFIIIPYNIYKNVMKNNEKEKVTSQT